MTAKTILFCATLIAISATAQTNKLDKDAYRKWFAEQQARDAVAKAAWRKRHEIAQTAVIVYGNVVQNVKGGLLMNCPNGLGDWSAQRLIQYMPKSVPPEVDHNHKWTGAKGYAFLLSPPNKSAIVDDDTVSFVGFPIGTYEYTSVNNSKKTILKYTASLDEAVAYWAGNTVADNK